MNTTPERTTITATDRQRIRQALADMPYGGLIMHRMPLLSTYDDRFVDQLVDTLVGLAVELRRVGTAFERTSAALRELQSQRDAMRAFLGVGERGE